jgi:hypothetical protein
MRSASAESARLVFEDGVEPDVTFFNRSQQPIALSLLPGVYAQIADELASQYTIGYVSHIVKRGGSWRRSPYTSRARTSRLAPTMATTRRRLVSNLRYVATAFMFGLCACRHEPARVGFGGPAPNPNGCYAFVYDRPEFRGDRVVLNGPERWRSLERLRVDRVDWRDRIRSLDVGPAATLTVYTAPNLTGMSRRFAPGSKLSRLEGELNDGIESLDLSCPTTNP